MPVVLINARGLSDAAHGLTIAALIIFFLYLAGVIVQPLAIAALLSFILAPVMRRLRIWGLPKVVSALFSVALTLTAIGALGTTLVMQGRQLADAPSISVGVGFERDTAHDPPLLGKSSKPDDQT